MQMRMSKRGSYFDNTVGKIVFSTPMCEWLHHQRFATRQEAQTVLFFYLIKIFYNAARRLLRVRHPRHSKLNCIGQAVFESTHSFQSRRKGLSGPYTFERRFFRSPTRP
jgi:hypothetical protein